MKTAHSFLADNGLQPAAIDAEALLQRFDDAMTRGLNGEAGGLAMIPAYVTIDRPVPVDRPVAVIDAGGTNLRVALVRFDIHGKPQISDLKRCRMPGAQEEVSAEAFYDVLADLLAPLARQADAIGFCFSYPAEITPSCDARLIQWTKQIKVPSVVNTMVGAGLNAHLARRGAARRVTVLNDTVATLLAGKSAGIARRYANYVGLILGTGTNTAYVEQNARIRKCPGLDPQGAMTINVESGAFAGVPQCRFDRLMDATTSDCGSYTFEKMIAGAYLGALGGTILREAAAAGLFSPETARVLRELPPPANRDVDLLCVNPFAPPPAFSAVPWTDDDRRTVLDLCTPTYHRATLLTAVNIAAAVIRTGAGTDPLHPVGVTIDGSTYYRTTVASFATRVQGHLRDLLEPRGLYADLLQVDEAPLIGAAVAGLTAQ